jgi:hypothetical protein
MERALFYECGKVRVLEPEGYDLVTLLKRRILRM